MKTFKVENLEKYREECQKTGTKSIKFENNIQFFNLGILGYVLTRKEKLKIQKLAQSKNWEEFKKQVEEWCYENK